MKTVTAHNDIEKRLLHDERSQQRDRASVKKNVTRILGLESSKDGIEHRHTSSYLLFLQEMRRRASEEEEERRGRRRGKEGPTPRGGIERRNRS